jgi:glycine betaine/choline ABC-type transport system substrate-binding protein
LDRAQAVAFLTAALLAGCSGTPRPITVGSKNFTEQVILGEIVARHLENRLHARVDRRLNLGGTLLAHQALLAGEIDVYPEYTGTALMAILKLPPATDPDAVFERVRGAYQGMHLEWLPPLGFDNSFAMVIRGEDARRNHIETLSQAAEYKPGWLLGAGYEFASRADGLPALTRTYQLRFMASPMTMDLGLLYQALMQNQVSMAAGSGTDGMLHALDVRVLRDDRHAFPPYQAALVARSAAFPAHPGLRQALAELSGRFPVETMRRLNHEVDAKHRSAAEVAAEFLAGALGR